MQLHAPTADVALDETAGESTTKERQPASVTLSAATPAAGADTISGTPPAASSGVDEGGIRLVGRDRYRVEDELARGGLGRILLARDPWLGRAVALKEVLRNDPGTVARFVREARITARLQHPNIVPVYEAGCWPNGEPFYAMRLISGRSLGSVVKGMPTLEERLSLVPSLVAVADAMAYAHSLRIIHRDLKPENVIVGPFGETVVIDWGLAKDLAAEEDESVAFAAAGLSGGALTMVGARVGTPAYMAPEQARGEPADERADVFALGALVMHVLTGEAPFRGRSVEEVIALAASAAHTDIEERQEGVPRDLATIVRKAMAPRPADRYPTARELADDLRRFQTGQLVSARRYSRWSLLARWLRRHRVAVSVAAASLCALTLTIALSVQRVVREKDRAEARTGELMLAQARLSLDHDPTAAAAWLKSYPEGAPGWSEARLVALDARQLGIARHVLPVSGLPSALTFEDGGRVLAAVSADSLFRWDAESGALLSRAPHAASPYSGLDLPPGVPAPAGAVAAALSPDGAWMASADSTNELRLWDRKTGEARVVGAHQGYVVGLRFSPDGALLASTAQDETLHLLRLATGETAIVRGHATIDHALAFSPDGRLLATSSEGQIRVWDVRPPPGRTLRGHEGRVTHAAFSPDGTLLATLSDRDVRLFDVTTGRLVQTGEHDDEAYGLSFSPDGRLLATASADGTVHLWTLRGSAVRVLHGHEGRVRDVAFSPDGTLLASAGNDGTVRLHRVDGDEPRILGRLQGAVTHVAFSPDGTELATSSKDRTVRVWGVASGSARVLGAHATDPNHVLFLANGALVSASEDAVKVWDLATGRARDLPSLPDLNPRPALSPDGQLLALPAGNRVVLVNLATMARRDLVGHDRPVHRCRFSHDGRRLVSVADDGTVRLWDLASLAVRILHRHQGVVFDAAFSPDDRLVASASVDKTAWIGPTDEGTEDALPQDPAAVRAALASWTTAVVSEDNRVQSP